MDQRLCCRRSIRGVATWRVKCWYGDLGWRKRSANWNKLIGSEWDRFRCRFVPISDSEVPLGVQTTLPPPTWMMMLPANSLFFFLLRFFFFFIIKTLYIDNKKKLTRTQQGPSPRNTNEMCKDESLLSTPSQCYFKRNSFRASTNSHAPPKMIKIHLS
jgi:hypothetical protein